MSSGKPRFVSLAGLKARGWTPAMVRKLLGEPDKLGVNPYYRSAAPVKLYGLERVEAAECLEAFVKEREKAARRVEAAKKAVSTRAAKLVEEARRMEVHVKVIPAEKLLRKAIHDYNVWKDGIACERGDWDYEPASEESDPAFLRRIQVNYVRHNLTNYDDCLLDVAGRTGVTEAVWIIREKIYSAIAEAYPGLAGECRRQAAERGLTLFSLARE